MRPLPPRARTPFAFLLLAALALAPAARAAKTPPTSGRLAAATGATVEATRSLPGGDLAVVAAGRPALTEPGRVREAVEAALDAAARQAAAEEDELARLNRTAAAERFACSADLYATLQAALAIAAATDGAYDPTDAPLARLWERPREGGAPDPLALADARQLVGWRLLLLEPGGRTVRFRRPGVELALDRVAGGRLMQRAAAAMRQRGIARARLERSGEVLAFTNHEAWMVAVPHPDDARATAMRLRVSNAAVATASGRDLLDPRTGRAPTGSGLVTVVTAPEPGAPALAAALRVLGREGAADYARRHADVGVLWLEPAGHVLRAWAWNLDAVEPEPDLRVEWQTTR